MAQTGISSLPLDVLEFHVFPLLPPPSMLSFGMVCRRWQNIAARRSLSGSSSSSKRSGQTLLEKIYKEGISVEFLEWFERHLGYPSPLRMSKPARTFAVTACGTFFYYS
jgi:hypothetical protein